MMQLHQDATHCTPLIFSYLHPMHPIATQHTSLGIPHSHPQNNKTQQKEMRIPLHQITLGQSWATDSASNAADIPSAISHYHQMQRCCSRKHANSTALQALSSLLQRHSPSFTITCNLLVCPNGRLSQLLEPSPRAVQLLSWNGNTYHCDEFIWCKHSDLDLIKISTDWWYKRHSLDLSS